MSKRVIHRFSKEEDRKILEVVSKYGDNLLLAMDELETKLSSNHSRRSIIERFKGFLSQSREKWTEDEDRVILESFQQFGNRWTLIAKFLANRSGDQVKIRYKQISKKKIVPVRPRGRPRIRPGEIESSNSSDSCSENNGLTDALWHNLITDFGAALEEESYLLF